MCYTFARVSAVVHMKTDDYFQNGKRWWIRLHEKGGKRHEVPAHHNAEEYLDAYLDAVGIWDEKKTPLFRSVDRTKNITENPLARTDVLRMIKRRAMAAGLPSPPAVTHSGRRASPPIWKTAGRLKTRRQSRRTNRRGRRSCTTARAMRITLDEVERIVIGDLTAA